MSALDTIAVSGLTPRIDSEVACGACLGRWVYDEVFGWLHNPGRRPDCVAPPPTSGTARF